MVKIKVVSIFVLLTFFGIQFVEVERTNPPVIDDMTAPQDITNILRTSCYDCHSNETKWLWYSKVAPFSWLIVDDVNKGRKHLNFSNWESYYSDKREELKRKIMQEVIEEGMPLSSYTYLHPKAKLDIIQMNTIKKWTLN